MAKIPAIKTYINNLSKRCNTKFGEDFVAEYEELVEIAARNKRQLDRIEAELDNDDLLKLSEGSSGQRKEDVNPLVKFRNDIAKLYADNLEALQLTPRSKYKKKDNGGDASEIDNVLKTLNS